MSSTTRNLILCYFTASKGTWAEMRPCHESSRPTPRIYILSPHLAQLIHILPSALLQRFRLLTGCSHICALTQPSFTGGLTSRTTLFARLGERCILFFSRCSGIKLLRFLIIESWTLEGIPWESSANARAGLGGLTAALLDYRGTTETFRRPP